LTRAHPRGRLFHLPSRGIRALPSPLTALAPDFAGELSELLEQAGHPRLARQITSLRVVEHCSCRELACASFYTVAPKRTPRRFNRAACTIHVAASRGSISVDLLNGRIVAVAVLDRPDIWDALTPLPETSLARRLEIESSMNL
jgi:hypothetical protein